MQLDLFLDGREAALVNDLIGRLLDGRPEAADALDRLRGENPAHPDLAAFDLLVGSCCEGSPARPGPGQIRQIIERLAALVPAANRLLGSGAATFLLPWWHVLARTEAMPAPVEAAALFQRR